MQTKILYYYMMIYTGTIPLTGAVSAMHVGGVGSHDTLQLGRNYGFVGAIFSNYLEIM